MAYLLVWSLLIGDSWVTGMAAFQEDTQCQEAKITLLSYGKSAKRGYIECTPIDKEDIEITKQHFWLLAKKNERILRKERD